MTNPSDHKLNAVLARVAGIKYEVLSDGTIMRMDAGHEWDTWNPVQNPIEMELVEEGLRKKQFFFKVGWYGTRWDAWVGTKFDYMGPADGEFGSDDDKKRAFALAVYAMDQERIVHGQDV